MRSRVFIVSMAYAAARAWKAAGLLVLCTAALVAGSAVPVRAETGWSYITLSPYYLVPGQSFTVSGGGFMSGERVSVSALGQTVSAVADSSGRFLSPAISVPPGAVRSTVSVLASGSEGDGGSATLTVGGFYPEIEPSSYYIIPGNSVRWAGTRFAPNECIAVSRDGVAIGRVESGADGAFTTVWIGVGDEPGRQRYVFKGEQSGVAVSRDISVSAAPPYVLLGRYYVSPGAGVSVSGRAFGSNERVSIGFDGLQIAATTADGSGAWEAHLGVPADAAAGAHEITARGDRTGLQAGTMLTVSRQSALLSGVLLSHMSEWFGR